VCIAIVLIRKRGRPSLSRAKGINDPKGKPGRLRERVERLPTRLRCNRVLARSAKDGSGIAGSVPAAPSSFATGGSGTGPSVAVDPSGNAVLAWTQSDGTNLRINAAFRPAGGAFGAPTVVSTDGLGALPWREIVSTQQDRVVVRVATDHDRAAVEDHLRRHALGGVQPEVDEQVPQFRRPLGRALSSASQPAGVRCDVQCGFVSRSRGTPRCPAGCSPP